MPNLYVISFKFDFMPIKLGYRLSVRLFLRRGFLFPVCGVLSYFQYINVTNMEAVSRKVDR